MHKLGRQIRFSINPFLDEEQPGDNSYASKPCGEGLALYLGLWVELAGEPDEETGFVVNVIDIDKGVRELVLPVFVERIKESYKRCAHVSIKDLYVMLCDCWGALEEKFHPAVLNSVGLELNPNRKIALMSEDIKMLYFSEKFEFAAMHTLWNDKFSDEKNFEIFGKCANRAGHGHNYVVEVTVKQGGARAEFSVAGMQRIVAERFIEIVDHKNLNVDVADFRDKNPTVENITRVGWERLEGGFLPGKLHKITVWETDRTYCSYEGGD